MRMIFGFLDCVLGFGRLLDARRKKEEANCG